MTAHLVKQFDGGPLAGQNCGAASGALLVQLESAGTKHPTASEFRNNVRNSDGSPDRSGGTNPSQIVECARRAYGVVLDQRSMEFDAMWSLGASADVAIALAISYGPIAPTQYDGSPGFTGNHAVVLSGGMVYDPLADARRRGIPRGPQRWPKALLRNACGRLNIAPPGTPYRSLGQGRALAVIAKAPAVAPKKFSVAFSAQSFFVYQQGTPWQREPRRFSKATSAPCEAPITIPWRSGMRKRVVRVSAGSLAGKYVEPNASGIKLVESKK
jgi:hypothetical protein